MPNPLIHWELMVNDLAKAKQFYGRVFDWRFDDAGPEYTMIVPGAPPNGGLMAKPAGAPMCSLNTYFRVDDLNRTLHDAVEAGAQVIVPRTEVPGVGWFAMFLDPDRIPIGIFEDRTAA